MLMAERTCQGVNEAGQPCRQAPLRDEEFCFWHSPTHAEAAAEARRAGGLNKRRERTLAAVYEFEGLESVDQVRRLFEIAGFEALALPAGPNKCRILVQVGLAGLKALSVGDHEERLQDVEAVLGPRLRKMKAR
jgi:hypothetical protein